VTFVESDYLNMDMCKSNSSQSYECGAQSADSSEVCSKLRAFNCPVAALPF